VERMCKLSANSPIDFLSNIFTLLIIPKQVQVRQKTNQKKTLFYLEQLLIKYEATRACLSIKPVHGVSNNFAQSF
jgi:hypothetical protein